MQEKYKINFLPIPVPGYETIFQAIMLRRILKFKLHTPMRYDSFQKEYHMLIEYYRDRLF